MRRFSTIALRTASVALTAIFAAAAFHAPAQAQDFPDKAKWDQTVAAAKKEGKLIVAGPSGKLWQGLLEDFQKDYPDIKIQVTSFAGRDFWPRVVKEREVKKYLWDIRVGGAETQAFKMIEEGGLAPVRDMYMLPDVAGDKNWYGGIDASFLDHGKRYMPAFCAYDSPLVFYNKDKIPEGQISEFKQILDPQWRGKIAMADPRGGSTIVHMGAVYKVFGADFLKQLIVDQKPIITANTRQLVTWFAQGDYPIVVGMPSAEVVRFEESGVKLNLGQVSGLDTWSAGVCGLQVLEPRPNPNATVVFVNWILTQKVQAKIMAAVQLNSRHRDVPLGDPERALDMEHLDKYMGTQTQDFEPAMAGAKELIRGLLK